MPFSSTSGNTDHEHPNVAVLQDVKANRRENANDDLIIMLESKSQHPNAAIPQDTEKHVGASTCTMLVSKKKNGIWYGLHTLNQLWYLLKKYEGECERIRIVTGNAVYGIQPLQQFIREQKIMHALRIIARIPDLTELKHDNEQIIAGCAVSIYNSSTTSHGPLTKHTRRMTSILHPLHL